MFDNWTSFINVVLTFVLQQKNYLLFAMSFFLGGAGACFISRTPLRLLLLDVPDKRSSHSVPIPRGGGFGILLVVILTGLALNLPTHFLFPAIFISLVSFYGDFFLLSIRARLLMQFAAALIIVFPSLPQLIPANLILPMATYPLIFFGLIIYVVGTANFYNFMDGINGIAGITGAIAFGLIGFFFWNQPTPLYFETLPVFSFCIALACLGFLPFNIPQARVFLGDVGSILLGFLFAAFVIKLSHSLIDFVCLTAFLFPFYADELTTLWIRLRQGENLSQAHRRHLYQILANEYQMRHMDVSLFYGVAQILVALTVTFFRSRGILFVLVLLMFYFIVFSCISFYLRRKLPD